jgi:hypothetical protein
MFDGFHAESGNAGFGNRIVPQYTQTGFSSLAPPTKLVMDHISTLFTHKNIIDHASHTYTPHTHTCMLAQTGSLSDIHIKTYIWSIHICLVKWGRHAYRAAVHNSAQTKSTTMRACLRRSTGSGGEWPDGYAQNLGGRRPARAGGLGEDSAFIRGVRSEIDAAMRDDALRRAGNRRPKPLAAEITEKAME